MKKILLSLSVFLGTISAVSAQEGNMLQKGDFLIEGYINYNKDKVTELDIEDRIFIVSPKVGYLISDKIAVGAQYSYVGIKEREGLVKSNINLNGVGVFGRYYFLDLGSKFKTYAEASVYLSNQSGETNENSETYEMVIEPDFKATSFFINLGAQYFITKSVAVNLELSELVFYQRGVVHSEVKQYSNVFESNLNSIDNIFSKVRFGLAFKF